jgi:hypothetical protein
LEKKKEKRKKKKEKRKKKKEKRKKAVLISGNFLTML